ncbi:hypothetical protein BT69DRAFT_1282450 [Atractiella rhizophila]|nr:hypothetical protein BT69DRAFT_1282450 [Atractiella rhizophila]
MGGTNEAAGKKKKNPMACMGCKKLFVLSLLFRYRFRCVHSLSLLASLVLPLSSHPLHPVCSTFLPCRLTQFWME